MISITADGILLDIEGTVSPIDFVYQTMFPFVRRELDGFLRSQWDDAGVQAACRRIAAEGNLTEFERQSNSNSLESRGSEVIRTEVLALMDRDAKSTGLKELQGLVWRRGFESGELVARLFSDAVPALRTWAAAGIRLFIYSSGSVAAQKLFFEHTESGDLRPLLSGYFDTTTGPKREPSSYRAIASSCDIAPARLLFLSDVSAELAAATSAGMQAVLTVRPGNAPVPQGDQFPRIESFAELDVRR